MEIEEPRRVIRFDPETLLVWSAFTERKLPTNTLRGVVVLEYVENTGATTPTGGKFISRRLTVRMPDGTKWVGQCRIDTDLVILRPYEEKN